MAGTLTMMDQYMKIKVVHKHCLLMFRVGDFYEMFFEDAVAASKALDITLTKKSYGKGQKADMCGVPHHSASGYISKLISKGYKVAVCEQIENPKDAKGIVGREVVRIITPGTVTDSVSLDDSTNNYICCICFDKLGYGIAFADFTTGEFKTSSFQSVNAQSGIIDELEKFKPSEIICNNSFMEDKVCKAVREKYKGVVPFAYDEWAFDYGTAHNKLLTHFKVHTLDGYGMNGLNSAICASGALLSYLYETQKNALSQICEMSAYSLSDAVSLDASTRRNLELTDSMNAKNKKNCLFHVLNSTQTSMGARLLKRYIEQPLTKISEINKRIEAVDELKNDLSLRTEVRSILKTMSDIERLTTRFVIKSANARDMIALKNSIKLLPELKESLKRANASYFVVMAEEIDTLTDIYDKIYEAIDDEPPLSVNEGGFVKRGYNYEIDELKSAKKDGAHWLEQLAQKEIEATGIKTLKIKNNRVFGYYIEVTKSNIHLAPDRYIRKQTLGNCERYTTEELKQLEEKITGAEEKLYALEYVVFSEILGFISENAGRILRTAQITALIDVCQSLAEVAEKNEYTKPVLSEDDEIHIINGRHPVVEKAIDEPFVANDLTLDSNENRLIIITGPNMAGKSTYMRQTALIVLMAQIGSFVPAEYCKIKPVDQIFTRVGASDDLAAGQSTFMVEMVEVANILRRATKDSLIILDEIGRGTSTFDGLSIAWAVLEHIADTKRLGAKTMFATHYHELTELEGKISGVKNFCVLVKEHEDGLIFLRKIQRGGAGKSLGVAVAKLAGVPIKVIKRSEKILKMLNDADITKKSRDIAERSKKEIEQEAVQPDFFTYKNDLLVEKISSYDITNMTPLDAMQALYDLQKDVKGL